METNKCFVLSDDTLNHGLDPEYDSNIFSFVIDTVLQYKDVILKHMSTLA